MKNIIFKIVKIISYSIYNSFSVFFVLLMFIWGCMYFIGSIWFIYIILLASLILAYLRISVLINKFSITTEYALIWWVIRRIRTDKELIAIQKAQDIGEARRQVKNLANSLKGYSPFNLEISTIHSLRVINFSTLMFEEKDKQILQKEIIKALYNALEQMEPNKGRKKIEIVGREELIDMDEDK